MKRLGYAAVAACAFFGWQVTASAEELSVPQAPGVEEIVVTGSYIKGTPEDAALPVDVITHQELLDRGNPSALDLIRSLPYVAATMGETNQFGANQGTIGSGNINLRGLGGIRTLVLMNGRRTTYTPAEGPAGVDTNLMPWAAIGRVEVLKDGAAATYGSDAIAGVVNLITRRDIDGLELNGEFRGIEDTDGDYSWYANWGWIGDHSNILVSYGQQYRAELQSTDRDWATPPYVVNNTGWSGFSTPGTFNPRNAANANIGPTVIDSNCTAVGGYNDGSACRFSFIPFDNLVDETEMQQVYAELNTEIAEDVNFHVEGLWAETVLPNYRTSPGYPPLSGPAGPGAGQFVVQSDPGGPSPFSNNPSVLTALAQTGNAGLVGVDDIRLNSWRPYGWGGVQALTGGSGGQVNRNTFDMARVSASIDGSVNVPFLEELGWDVAVTYSDSEMGRTGVDTMITRLESALNGLGGAGCNGIPYGRTGSTCQYFNPFSNAIARNPAQGLVNPGFVPANANSPDLIDWMIQRWNVKQTQSLLVVDAVVNAEIPGFELPGGAIGWAFGSQYRLTDYQSSDTNPLIDAQANPCPIPGQTNCAFKTGPFIFLGQFIDQELDDTVYAVFGELHAPITDKIDAQLAVRYEDYGGLTGDTLDPKLSLRWQALESLALRGSVGSTFRGPTPVNKSLIATGLQPIPAAGFVYKAIDFVGNPELQPEKADTFSVGFVLELGGFKAIVDYWSYEFEDQITSVAYTFVTNAVLGAGTGAQFANCAHPLRYLLTFDQNNTCTQGVTIASQMERVKSPVVNGAPVDTTGYDMSFSYDFGEVFGGTLTTGIDATYVDSYEQKEFIYGGAFISPTYEAAGNANYERFPGTIAQWRGLGNINYAWDAFNFRYELRYVEGVDDERATPNVVVSPGVSVPVLFGKQVDEYVISNLFVNWNAPWDTVVSLSIVNLTDEDPSEARQALSYDPYIGDPLGRTWEIGIRKTFSAK